MSKKISINALSVKSIGNAIKELEQYKIKVTYYTQLLAERLAQEGVYIGRVKVAENNAIYTGELVASIKNEYGGSVPNGALYYVYTDCEWAAFVEFGVGMIGANNPHPDTKLTNWKYDVNGHGADGWYYQKDGEWYWTKGFESSPFMYETGIELEQKIVKIAREVFKGQ